jgi:hypothetical protein
VSNETENRLSWLEKLLAFGEAEVKKIDIPEADKDLRFPLLFSNTLAVQRLAHSVTALVKDGAVEGVPPILRSMVEAFINTKYLMDDVSQMRARAYILDDHTSRIKFINKVLESQRDAKFLGKPLTEWRALKNELTAEIREWKRRYGEGNLNWLNLWERARRIKEESMYLTVYWLFSQEVHVTSRGTSKFVKEDENGNIVFVHNPDVSDDVEKYLLTCFSLYLIFLKLCSQYFGIPIGESLEPFDEALKRMAS